ncbi:MAG: DEAD/DEAH box helicase [Alphaproteobacteria bacterium]|nr:DEAD/DEAH box helicase [Alphaproteobacteria bacterium]
MSFETTPPALARALAERDYKDATPVQAAVLEPEAEGRDLLVSAQTGSGKTIAYGLAMADTLLEGAETMGPAGSPLALVVAPTRELALQVERELSWLYRYAGARVVSCVGGMDPSRERRALQAGAHIVVGTPGRLRDHLERRALKVSSLKAAVLDEADEMLDMGFREDLEFILETTPPERRTLLFSATLPKAIVNLASHYQKDALRIATAGEMRGHADIEYRAIRIAPHKIERAVINLLRFLDAPGALVFCNTRHAVRHMEAMLLERGFAAVALSGELSQSERNHALQALRDGRARVCVATDVAARGIDLPNLDLVIHAELPNDAEVLQHRSGRTGRAGRKGISILLVPPSRRRRAEEMLGRAKVQAAWGNAPSAEEIRKLDQERLMQSALLTEPGSEDDLAIADALLTQHDPRAIAAAFVKMCRAKLPAPEEIEDEAPFEQRPRNERQRDERPRRQDREEGPRQSRDQERRGNPPRERGPAPAAMTDGVWFRLNVGRERKADPKWLLPEICRQGEITKKDVGAIRVFDTETLFQVDAKVAEQFAALVSERKKGGIRILPAPDQSGESHARPRGPQADSEAAPETPRKEGGFHKHKKFGGKKFDNKRFDKNKKKPGNYPPKRKRPGA